MGVPVQKKKTDKCRSAKLTEGDLGGPSVGVGRYGRDTLELAPSWTTSTGPRCVFGAAAARRTSGTRSPPAVVVVKASTTSTPGSAPSSSRQRRQAPGPTRTALSTGAASSASGLARPQRLPRDPGQASDLQARVGARVGGESAPTRVLNTTATRLLAGTGWTDSSAAASSSLPRSETAIMPDCSNRACRVSSGVAALAVGVLARRSPWLTGPRSRQDRDGAADAA